MNTILINDSQNDTFSLLRRLGLTCYEAVAYLALVKYGPQDCRSLSRLAGIPNGKIYLTTKNLVEKGWIQVSEFGRPKKLCAVDPENIIKKRLTELKEELNHLETNSIYVSMMLKNSLNPQNSEPF